MGVILNGFVTPAKAGFLVEMWWQVLGYPAVMGGTDTTDGLGEVHFSISPVGSWPIFFWLVIPTGQVVDGTPYGGYTSEKAKLYDTQEADFYLYPEEGLFLTSQISSVASLCTMSSLWPATLHTSEYTWDLTGTDGIAFYWEGTGDNPEIRVDFILESPTGFWLSSFYDGPVRWRLVFLPWGSFTWVSLPAPDLDPHHHGFNEPDKSQITGFYWTMHTPGLRRIDYIYAPVGLGGDLFGEFNVRQPGDEDVLAIFIVRRTASAELLGEFNVRHSDLEDLLGELIIRHSDSEGLPAELIIRRSTSRNLSAGFTVNP